MSANDLRPWQPRPGEWNLSSATHLLDRGGFGPLPGQAEALLALYLATAVDTLMQPGGHDPVYLRGIEIMLGAGELEPVAAWWMGLIVGDGDPLGERLTLMWHDHFATSNDKVLDPRLMHGQNQLFRELGRGDFRGLCHAVAKDPCMLKWLDGDLNRAGAPNENFAREVMELFVLGIGHYTEKDIREAARAFSGWGTAGRAFRYRERYHDAGEKTVLGRTAVFSPEEMLDWILEQPAAAWHIARKLLAEFITTEPSNALVECAAARLVELDWHVGALTRELLASEAFFAPEARRALIAGPVEWIARTVRRLGLNVPPRELARQAAEMGQSLFRPPSVKGWDGGEVWINAGTWTARHNAALEALARHSDAALEKALGTPASKAEAADLALDGLLPGLESSDALRQALTTEAEACASRAEALRLATALVLVSPEAQRI